LREITFRAVGEGTGRALDIDSFDQRYRHLFIWHRERREVVGAYRVGVSERLLAAEGISGLYTSTLFRFDRRLFDHMGPALELGRSFIRLEYQRSFSGLLLLWKGVGRLVVDQPEHAVLFGPVSISASYRKASQQLIAAFLKQNAYRHAASRWVRSRTPFRGRTTHGLHRVVPELRDLDEVSAFIADLEVDRKGIPILLRQYLKVGGRLLGFNVDPAFSNVLDVLVMVDLRTTPEKILARYLGIEGAASFLAHHRRRSPTEPGLEQFVRMHS
jgi:putative hemolysin